MRGSQKPYLRLFVLRVFIHESVQSLSRRNPNSILNNRRPSQQNARRPQRHPAPSPEIECVRVTEDLPILKFKAGFYDVVNWFACSGEFVPGLPLTGSVLAGGIYLAENYLQIL